MFIHERNNMSNIILKKIYLIAIFSLIFAIDQSTASQAVTTAGARFSLLQTAEQWIQKGYNAKLAAVSFLVLYLSHQYYNHKKRPSDEDISAEGYARRKYEILHGNHSLLDKIKMLISFVDDFYIFGRRGKSIERIIKQKSIDGTITVSKDKETIIKSTGPVSFLYDNVFDGLDTILKSIGVFGTLVLLVERLLAGQIDYLTQPSTAKYFGKTEAK